jgi:hypothetical protein
MRSRTSFFDSRGFDCGFKDGSRAFRDLGLGRRVGTGSSVIEREGERDREREIGKERDRERER